MNLSFKMYTPGKIVLISFWLILGITFAQAQKNANMNYPKDSVIKVDFVDPFEKAAADNGKGPEWSLLNDQISAKYDSAFAARLVNKAQIYFYYGKDWPAFSSALVRYTVNCESNDNLQLLNKNAGLVLQYSTTKQELETALGWSKHAVEMDPGNSNYQKTYDELKVKIAGM